MKKSILIVTISTLFISIAPCRDKASGSVYGHRLMNITEFNAAYGLSETDALYAKHFIGLTSVFAYGITGGLSAGIGTGILFYNGGNRLPLFTDIRYKYTFNKLSVQVFTDGGALVPLSASDDNMKLFINPGAGLMYSLTGNMYATSCLGLYLQEGVTHPRDSFINLKVGIIYLFTTRK